MIIQKYLTKLLEKRMRKLLLLPEPDCFDFKQII